MLILTLLAVAGLVAGVAVVVSKRHHGSDASASKLTTDQAKAAKLKGLRLASGELARRQLTLRDMDLFKALDVPSEWIVAEDARESDLVSRCLPGLAHSQGGWLRHFGQQDLIQGGIHGQVLARISTYADADEATKEITSRKTAGYRRCYLDELQADLLIQSGGGDVQPANVTSQMSGSNDDGVWTEYRTAEPYTINGNACWYFVDHRWQQVGAEVVETSFETCGAPFPGPKEQALMGTLRHRVDGSRDPALHPEGAVPPPLDTAYWVGMSYEQQIRRFLQVTEFDPDDEKAIVGIEQQGETLLVYIDTTDARVTTRVCDHIGDYYYFDPSRTDYSLDVYLRAPGSAEPVLVRHRARAADGCNPS